MRTLVASVSIVLAAIYAIGAVYFYFQERWARSPLEASAQAISDLHHPEATLGVVRLEANKHTPSHEQLPRLHQFLRQAPSFYQPPLFLAQYYANRVEQPAVVRKSFELALGRFPANGRLHASYAEWVLTARSDLAGWMAFANSEGESTDPLVVAESHFRTAVQLEPGLTDRVLTALDRHHIPPRRWIDLVPNDDRGRHHLLAFLFRAGHDRQALVLLREMLITSQDMEFLRQATDWALQRGEARLGLEAALKWEEAERRNTGPNSFRWALPVSRAHFALGDPDAAYQTFRSAIKQIEQTSGASSRASRSQR